MLTTPALLRPHHLNFASTADPDQRNVAAAPGLHYLPEFITAEQQVEIIRRLDRAEWNNDLRRPVQQYGWRYDYQARAITPDLYLATLPDWLQALAQQVYDETGLFARAPEQVIVNEYRDAQSIAEHTDHPGFGRAIATVSLIEDWEMNFAPRYRQPTRPTGKRLLPDHDRPEPQPLETLNPGAPRRTRRPAARPPYLSDLPHRPQQGRHQRLTAQSGRREKCPTTKPHRKYLPLPKRPRQPTMPCRAPIAPAWLTLPRFAQDL